MANGKTMGGKSFYTVPFVWSRKLWVMTFAIFILWIGLSGVQLYELFVAESKMAPLISLVVFNLIMLPTILVCEGYAPQRLEIGATQLVILRRYKSIIINADEVRSVEQLSKEALRGAIRTGGVGGCFGWYGNYYTRRIGSFKLYATQFENLFLITLLNGKKIVISCSEPEKISHFSV